MSGIDGMSSAESSHRYSNQEQIELTETMRTPSPPEEDTTLAASIPLPESPVDSHAYEPDLSHVISASEESQPASHPLQSSETPKAQSVVLPGRQFISSLNSPPPSVRLSTARSQSIRESLGEAQPSPLRSPSPRLTLPRPSSAAPSAAPRTSAPSHLTSHGSTLTAEFNLLAGKTLSEISNALSEASSFLSNTGHSHEQIAATGITGETMFAIGGMWQALAAAKEIHKAYSTLDAQKDLLIHSIDFLKGVSNVVSGIAGDASVASNKLPVAGKISSIAWAFSEGVNFIEQGHELLTKEKKLSKEQMVHVGQVLGSLLKFSGIVAQLAGVSGNTPVIAQAVGTAAGASSGILNLHHKGYDANTTFRSYLDRFVNYLRNGQTGSQRQRNIEAV